MEVVCGDQGHEETVEDVVHKSLMAADQEESKTKSDLGSQLGQRGLVEDSELPGAVIDHEEKQEATKQQEGQGRPASDGASGAETEKVHGSCRVLGTVSLLKMEEKFSSGQYQGIGDFVADFKAMLEGCYQLHGVDHWLSKQAHKLELMLEQKLSLLSRNSRDKTLLVLTSKDQCGLEDKKEATCTSTRRRSTTRSLSSVNTGAVKSLMVHILRQIELLRAKEEKRLKEQEKREAEEASLKEVEEWDKRLLAFAEPSCMETMWEIPAIGHFLCLAQQILNLPEIVFYELERCLLMPQCNVFLSKIMSSLLSPPHRRTTLHRRPNLPYRAWEAALRQKVQQWYTIIGQAENPDRCAEKLGLCAQFFQVLGEVSPLEEKAFHELPFQQKVWLLKGLCDFVYETQNEVQDAVLAQPIHECREVILGYDAQENAYIHFPQFCGADVRVYKQKPFRAPQFPVPPIHIKRTPKIKPDKTKNKNSNKSNGELRSTRCKSPSPGDDPEHYCEHHEDHYTKCNDENYSSSTEQDVSSACEIDIQRPCKTIQTGCCKENMEKPVSPGELVGFGEPLSPGEIRILENVDKYEETNIVKQESSPLKENALKTCKVNVNGSHNDGPDFVCHRGAVDTILDHSSPNHKKQKLRRMRAKKKKKKKKLKTNVNENLQGKCESLQLHTLKSIKTEIQSKLYIMKKRVKHKKHKSGKKAISKRTVEKKRTVIPTAPEFQLVCTNLDELRELIKKIDGELKGLENNKKKSEKWHFKRQGVKELHSTLVRLLNELLPWEPKLVKAFQRNRARLKKDYDDFKKLPDYEHFIRESSFQEESQTKESPNSVTNTEILQQEALTQDCIEKSPKTEMEVSLKGRSPKKDSITKDLLKSPPRTCKRQYKQCMYADNEPREALPRKKVKFSSQESVCKSMESVSTRSNTCCSSTDHKERESEAPLVLQGSPPAPLAGHGTKPIQALLAKDIGNKVALTSQLAQSSSKNIFFPESSGLLPSELGQTKPQLCSQTTSKAPLQMIYKLPDGQCLPIDLQNSPVRIQMQPVIDSKTGDKLMQQVLCLPKNLFVQHKDGQNTTLQSHLIQPNTMGQHCITNVPPSSVPFKDFVTPATTTHHTSSLCKKSVIQLAKSPNLVTSLPSLSTEQLKTSQSNSSVLAANSPNTMMPSVISLPVQADRGNLPPGRGNNTLVDNMANAATTLNKDLLETKQELKTVCIRDSQSILVRTRGGNTGVVKVQTNQDQSPSVISPVFSFTTQPQPFLVSKSKTSSSSTFTSISPSTTAPLLLPCFHSSQGLSTPPVIPHSSSVTKDTDSNITSSKIHLPNSEMTCQVPDNIGQPSHLLTTASTTKSWLPSDIQGKVNITTGFTSTVFCNSIRQGNVIVTQAMAGTKQTEPKASDISVAQPDSTTTTDSELINAPSLQKLMLVAAPPILSPGSSPKMSLLTAPTSSGLPSQKLLFINAQIPAGPPNSGLTLQTTKQASTPVIGKTFVKTAEQPQLILIPSNMASAVKVNSASTLSSCVKMNSAPIVSQVKDVKIGLTIGQTFVNSSVAEKHILPINVLQNTLSKGEGSLQSFAVPGAPNINQVQTTGQCVGIGGDCMVTKSKDVAASAKVPSTGSVGTLCTTLGINSNNTPRCVPAFSNRPNSATVGNTVAISTVKTGHLSSSVLLSTTMSGRVNSVLSPVSMAYTSLGVSPKVATPAVGTQPAPKGITEKVQFPSTKFTDPLAINVMKPQAIQTPLLMPTVAKVGPAHSGPQGPSHVLQTVYQPKAQLSDSNIHQKIVLNTSTPLAPGTQITINGTRFIVPPQGLGVGSHILLISTNAKQGHSLAGNCAVFSK
ncbi:uncharacterized protein KIAA2026 homolog [Spea bombifrons]|uniref:uncharacterized protein KIAA2026 homolog n=1 Tax=Spea bombifrons TaxID=233779 RepID=UPI00234922D1|nr:uncharacterized protein KIAA2026 homolog [Spea bombifrons]